MEEKPDPRRSQNPHPYKSKGAAPTVASATNKRSYVNDILARCPMNQEDSLLHPPETLNTFTIPAGTRIYQGGVAGGADGASQIFINDSNVLIPK